jgi:hypothetical protein
LEPYDDSMGIWADRLSEIRLVHAAEKLYLMEGSYHSYTVGIGVSSIQSKKNQITSLIFVNQKLLQYKKEFSFNENDAEYLKYAICRDEFDLNPSISRLLKFIVKFIANYNNGVRLRDFKNILPEWVNKTIKQIL